MMKVIRAVVTIGVLVVAWTTLVLTAALQGVARQTARAA
jgi:hypothetical protein